MAGGIVIALILVTLFAYAFASTWPQAAASKALSNAPPPLTTPFVSSTTPSVTEATNNASKDLEVNKYIDAKYNFSINHIKGWSVDTSGTNANLEFDDPTTDEVALETVTVDDVQSYGYDFPTVAKGVIHNFKSSAGPNADVKVVAEGNTTLGGDPAYEYEITFNYIVGSQSYPFHGIFVISLHSGKAYSIYASSLEQIWGKYVSDFDASISSFQF